MSTRSRWTSLLALAFAFGCSDGAGPGGVPASSALDRTSLELFATEIRLLHATVRDERGRTLETPVTWNSANAAVARIDALGRVTGVGEGRTTIEARAGAFTAQLSVTTRPTLNFAAPLRGQLNRDFFYAGYVDVQAGAGLRDYQCGLRTYDGHSGTDIALPSFARMDQGVDVMAAAPGTVSALQDGFPDRNKIWGPGLDRDNFVVLNHRDGFTSYYGHLWRNSMRVSVGQLVQTGTVIAQVGSSGRSTMPHLHIEFAQNGTPIEAHAGTCGASFTHWAAPPDYQDQFRLISSGTTRTEMTLDVAKDPPAQVDTFNTSDPRIWVWVQVQNLRAGSVSRFRLVSPASVETEVGYLIHNEAASISWWWVSITPSQATTAGTWLVRYYNDIDQLVERSFVITQSNVAPRRLPDSTAARSAIGGGAITRLHQ
ncbi:MAG: peptidoglycan DD-metalloendopeptidase family protein [Longimicrobiales bacterium]